MEQAFVFKLAITSTHLYATDLQ